MPLSAREELLAEVAELSKQQLSTIEDATFVGWTAEHRAAFYKRSNRLQSLLRQLESNCTA